MIPNFTCTEQALDFGTRASEKEAILLIAKRKQSLKRVDILKQINLQEALNEAVRAQFYREALEAYQAGDSSPT